MRPLTKILLTIGASLLFIGCIICVGAYIFGESTLARLDINTEYTAKAYELESADVTNIEFDTDRHDIIIRQSSAVSRITIEYYENEYDLFVLKENESGFSITNKQLQNWFLRRFCLLFDRKNTFEKVIIVTIPSTFGGSVDIKTSNGDLTIEDIRLLENLNVDISSGDTLLTSVNCTNAVLSIKTGELDIEGGVYTNLTLTVANSASYVPIDEVDGYTPPPTLPDITITPGVTLRPTLTPTPSVTPDAEPEETPDADEPMPADEEDGEPAESPSESPEETPDATDTPEKTPGATPDEEPDETPEATPSRTPKPTKTPTVLVVDAVITLNNIDCINLNITVYNTNIKGNIVRSMTYYNITTNNIESSNIVTTENITALGSITIDQKGGSTELLFR